MREGGPSGRETGDGFEVGGHQPAVGRQPGTGGAGAPTGVEEASAGRQERGEAGRPGGRGGGVPPMAVLRAPSARTSRAPPASAFPADGHQRQRASAAARRRPACSSCRGAPSCWRGPRAVLTVFALMVLGARTPSPDITRMVIVGRRLARHRPRLHGGATPWSVWSCGRSSAFYPCSSWASTGRLAVPFAQVVVANAACWRPWPASGGWPRRHCPDGGQLRRLDHRPSPAPSRLTMGYPDSCPGRRGVGLRVPGERPVACGLACPRGYCLAPNGFVVAISHRRRGRPAPPARSGAGAHAGRRGRSVGVVPRGVDGVCWYHTGDPLVFFSAKSAAGSSTRWSRRPPTYRRRSSADGGLAGGAVRAHHPPPAAGVGRSGAPVACRRWPPRRGGLGRYAVQCFPLAIAAGRCSTGGGGRPGW
jgi:hypothetical protein